MRACFAWRRACVHRTPFVLAFDWTWSPGVRSVYGLSLIGPRRSCRESPLPSSCASQVRSMGLAVLALLALSALLSREYWDWLELAVI